MPAKLPKKGKRKAGGAEGKINHRFTKGKKKKEKELEEKLGITVFFLFFLFSFFFGGKMRFHVEHSLNRITKTPQHLSSQSLMLVNLIS
jgi:hypothetical protein